MEREVGFPETREQQGGGFSRSRKLRKKKKHCDRKKEKHVRSLRSVPGNLHSVL